MKKLLKIFGGTFLFFILVYLVLYFATWGNYSVAKTVTVDKSLPVIRVGDRFFHGETFGKKIHPPVIVLHGGPGGDYRNLLTLKALANRYFVVFYDQAGSGLSPRQKEGTITLETALTDLDLIVDSFRGRRQVSIIGHSWGAMLATAYTGRHPDKVKHLVLAEPGFLTPSKATEFMFKTRPPMTAGALWFLVRTWFESLHIPGEDHHDRYDYIMERMITGFDSPDHPLSGYFCDNRSPATAKNTWRFGFSAWQDILQSAMDESGKFSVSFIRGIEAYKRKVLFVTGECNILTGGDYQDDHIKLFTKTHTAVIAGAGHLMFSEKPRESIAVVRKFFRGEL